MDIHFIYLIAIISAILAIGVILLIVRRIDRNTNIIEARESELNWDEVQCPKCDNTMSQGYSMTGKGVIWSERGRKKPGTFSHIGQALENTISFNISPALNVSWHCHECKLVLLDHSRMVKIKEA